MFDRVLMPTPAAVLEGARLLADGCAGGPGSARCWSSIPGGATTDVHSVARASHQAGVIPQGLPEPRVKRTVEGDLGMRHNVAAIVEAAGPRAIAADSGLDATRVRRPDRRAGAGRGARAAQRRGRGTGSRTGARRGATGGEAPRRQRRDRLHRIRSGDRAARQGSVRRRCRDRHRRRARAQSAIRAAVLETRSPIPPSRCRCGRAHRGCCSTASTCSTHAVCWARSSRSRRSSWVSRISAHRRGDPR